MNEHFCIAMTDGSFRIHTITSAPYTNGSTTIRIKDGATDAEVAKAIVKAVKRNEKEFVRYLANLEKQKVRKEQIRREILSYGSVGCRAGVDEGMNEGNATRFPSGGDFEGAILAQAEERYSGE